MTLKDKLTADMKTAMRARDKGRLGVIRMALAAIKQREVDDRVDLDEPAVLGVIEKMVKQRRESVRQYRDGGRNDLADAEQAEIDLLTAYLPEPLDDAELDRLIDEAIAETGATGMRDMGKVMASVKSAAEGRADMASVSGRVRDRLSN